MPRRRDSRGLLIAAVISLLPVIALAIPARLRIPRSREARPDAPPAWALFSHRGHEPLRCYQCHPSVFPQSRVAFTHTEMDQGRFCASCHDGRRAPAVQSFPCESCHVPDR